MVPARNLLGLHGLGTGGKTGRLEVDLEIVYLWPRGGGQEDKSDKGILSNDAIPDATGLGVCKGRSSAVFACLLNWFCKEGLQSWGTRGWVKLSVCIRDSFGCCNQTSEKYKAGRGCLVHHGGEVKEVRVWGGWLHCILRQEEERDEWWCSVGFPVFIQSEIQTHGMVPSIHSGIHSSNQPFL